MSAWSNLPNAKYIDEIIESVATDPIKWAEAWEKVVKWNETLNDAYKSAREVIYDTARSAEWNAVWRSINPTVIDAAWRAAGHAVLALVAYDDCDHLLTTNPEHVKMLAGIGNEAAILLYPATLVFSEIKNEYLV